MARTFRDKRRRHSASSRSTSCGAPEPRRRNHEVLDAEHSVEPAHEAFTFVPDGLVNLLEIATVRAPTSEIFDLFTAQLRKLRERGVHLRNMRTPVVRLPG